MRTLDPDQLALVEAQSTKPNYGIRVELDQPHTWFTNESGELLENGRVRLDSISGEEVRFSFWNLDYQWTQNAINGVYLRRPVSVFWTYFADPEPSAIQLFEGFIYSMPSIGEWIEVVAQATPPKLYPSLIVRQPQANFLPPAGYSVEFDGAILQIEE